MYWVTSQETGTFCVSKGSDVRTEGTSSVSSLIISNLFITRNVFPRHIIYSRECQYLLFFLKKKEEIEQEYIHGFMNNKNILKIFVDVTHLRFIYTGNLNRHLLLLLCMQRRCINTKKNDKFGKRIF